MMPFTWLIGPWSIIGRRASVTFASCTWPALSMTIETVRGGVRPAKLCATSTEASRSRLPGTRKPGTTLPPSIESVLELAVLGGEPDGLQRLAVAEPLQVLERDARQDGVGEDRVDDAPARLRLSAARDDQLDDIVAVFERNAVVGGDALLDPAELQPDDVAHHLVGQRVVGNDDEAAEQ